MGFGFGFGLQNRAILDINGKWSFSVEVAYTVLSKVVE